MFKGRLISTPFTTWWRTTLFGLLLLPAIFMPILATPQRAEAKWTEFCESGKAAFEILPVNLSVQASLDYELMNLDFETVARDVYYFRWSTGIPSSATNVRVLDDMGSLSFTTTASEYWTLLSVNLRRDLYFGDKAYLTVTCHCPTPIRWISQPGLRGAAGRHG
jgi:hypothetical protein